MPPSLFNLITPTRLTEVVDIGANPIDGTPPYKSMLDKNLCRITGFEPQESALLRLLSNKGRNENYLPYAVGDGKEHLLNICSASGMSSLLEPDQVSLELFSPFTQFGKVENTVAIKTNKLDDIAEIINIDFLKIDIQGSELSVFNHGKLKLSQAVAIQTEVSFFPFYKNQPSFGEVDQALRAMNFIPHHIVELKKWPIRPTTFEQKLGSVNQLLEADILYVRNYKKHDLIDSEQLKHLALITHYCYQSYDLTLFCIQVLEEREECPINSTIFYRKMVEESLMNNSK